MENSKNLPAINRQIDLFTTAKNVNKDMITNIENSISQIKNLKIKGDLNGLSIDISKYNRDIDIDTFAYIVNIYGFSEVYIESDYKNNIRCKASLRIEDYKYLYLYSTPITINLLPNDIKSIIKN